MTNPKNYFLLFLSIASIQNIKSQDRQFVRTYQSTVLPKGAMDLEAWSTFRTGRKYFYNALDTRLEMEVGLTNKLQTALYFNGTHSAFAQNKDTLGGIADTSMSGVLHQSEFSMSSEWKLKLMDPSTDPIGFAVYAELTFGTDEFEIENKLIFDKRTEKNIFAFNLVNEYEFAYDVKKGKTQHEWEDEPEVDLAYMHLLKTNFGIGLEAVNKNEIEDEKWNFSAVFAGPTFYYSGGKHFLILNVLPQWANLYKTEDAPNNLVLNAHEKLEVRLLLGFSF
ncbi:MAG: hypothetical protein HY063_14105 [Bacteroidetes bacterium]|nr:hypothetical protein [Bacteroidota bacterium]